ncbi:MAG TPA: hypothetical protein VL360_06665 [Gammaproteobacteria bacterium]|nr:hypothetical protein [Gammaproteobacteria bacterium]
MTKGSVTIRQRIAILVSIMVLAISDAGWAAAGDATSIPKPPLFQNPNVNTNVTQKTVKSGPVSTTVVNASYNQTVNLTCPIDNSHCPDINNKCHAPDGLCPSLTAGTGDPNYSRCPETCVVNRTISGSNANVTDQFGNQLPLTDVEPICPTGYTQIGSFNLQPELKPTNGTPVQLPWPMTGVYANNYPNNFNNRANYHCDVQNPYTITYCGQTGSALTPPSNATPLNGTLPPVYNSIYGQISLSYDTGYSNNGPNVSSAPTYGPTCYMDPACTVTYYAPTLQCTVWTNPPQPAGCNTAQSGAVAWCISGSLYCCASFNWSCTMYCCSGGCGPGAYRRITRTVYPNICWYKGRNLAPGSGLVPASIVCGRNKPSWI